MLIHVLIDFYFSYQVFGDKEKFENAVRLVIDNVSFDVDSKIQVFEVNIRVLGALVSTITRLRSRFLKLYLILINSVILVICALVCDR